MPRTLQFKRTANTTLATTTGANGELIIDSTNQTLTIHDGLTQGGYRLATEDYARVNGGAASRAVQSDWIESDNTQAGYIRNKPNPYNDINVASYMTTYTGNVSADIISSNNISANTIKTDHYLYANGQPVVFNAGAGVTGNFVFAADTMSLSTEADMVIESQSTANVTVASSGYVQLEWRDQSPHACTTNMWVEEIGAIIENINNQQWHFDNDGTLTVPAGLISNLKDPQNAQDATTKNYVDTSNTAMKAYVDQANTGMASYVVSTNTAMQAYVDQANTGLKSYVDQANTGMASYVVSTNTAMQAYVDQANTGLKSYGDATYFAKSGGTVSGSVSITTDLTVSGNLTVSGSSVTLNTSSIAANDTLIYLGVGNYVSDTVDIGFVGHYNNSGNAHTGLIRDPNLKEYIIFKGYTPEIESNNVINIAHPSFAQANLYAAYFKGNLIANTVSANGIDVYSTVTSAFNQANSANTLAQSAFNKANSANTLAQSGFDKANSANTLAQSSFNQANSANTLAQSAFNKANSANTLAQSAFNQANSANTLAQSAFNQANSANTLAQSSFNKANSANTLAQAAFDKANTVSNTFTNITVNGTASLNGLTQVQQLDLPYTAKTLATGTVTHDCSVGQIFYHTSISGNFTANLVNLGILSGYITEVVLYLVQGSSSRSISGLTIAGSAKTINWYNAVNPTYSTNAVDVVTFTILLVNTTYTVFGKVEKYDSVAAGGGGGG